MKKLKLKKHLKEAINHTKECRYYIFFIILFFSFNSVLGYIFSENLRFLDKYLSELIEKAQNLNFLEMLFFILQNNLKTAFIGVILGVFSIGLYPLFSAGINGIVIGYVVSRAVDSFGIFIVWKLLPHGIFELPAIFIALGMGLHAGMFIFSKNKKKEFKNRFYNCINSFLVVILPLLTIAAFIESILIFLF